METCTGHLLAINFNWCKLMKHYHFQWCSLYYEQLCYTLVVELLTKCDMLQLVVRAQYVTGNLGISTRPRSVALLLASTASKGLLCLLVGAHVHCGRSNTEVSVWLLPCTYHIWCMTYVSAFSGK